VMVVLESKGIYDTLSRGVQRTCMLQINLANLERHILTCKKQMTWMSNL
jgi:hypothetical protein